ncbi:bifunctional demethylmenaquinone methyltransferase/2-methoxy-6-polyprenyl-1,4-benzoquinol methylase UbiE [Candidatus Pelagibacter sp.]|jgi:demethylmenaquinone methyltransferase / 2-methoxy-6-polyprenyl-1,4-benzoquinol methylase|nr:bifunctional demethylmenaquinone methyltransferase/2-methoxy-6-polyprenyl-1,4-benzoquinol methylase UbiE [Candidatus Pelagibacter sp.]
MQQYLQNKKGLVQGVFDKVYDKYDLMNDFMSLGIHRVWKKNLMNWMNPSINKVLIDVACGTGDLGKLFLNLTNKESKIFCVDPNSGMISKGKQKLSLYKNINWMISSAEKLPVKDNSCDYYTISFGLRNTKNLNKVLSEAYRVLKPGGRYLCLEFSKIQNSNLEFIYKNYSRLIPLIGKAVVGKKEPYEYLIKSIDEFINQEELIELMKGNKFENCSYRNLSGGIVAIHSGWKIK